MNKVKTFNFNYSLPFSAETVWQLLADDYGNVANYANGLVSSQYINGSAYGREGAQRLCNMNENGKTYLIERMVDVDVNKMQFTNEITEVARLPIAPLLSKTIFKITANTPDSCQLSIEVHMRTKPAFLVMLMGGASKKQMTDLVIGMQHYLETKETVTKANFSKIRKLYSLAS